ncbi:MAG: serine hydrolase [Lachnospiraceae bacterium]|nr:serine hydrolase [Lachnospiraceae bacterium]
MAYDYSDLIDLDKESPVREVTRRPVKRRRKKRRSGGAGLAVALFLPIIVLLVTVCFLLYQRLPDPKKELVGTWMTAEDVTVSTALCAQKWLSEAAFGSTVDVPAHFQESPIELLTRLELTEKNEYRLSFDENSYQKAKENASRALSDALIELIGIRIKAVDPESPEADPEQIRTRFAEALTKTPEEYLSEFGPELFDPLDDYRTKDKSGSFTADPDSACIRFDGSVSCDFVVNGDLLFLAGGGFGRQTLFSRVSSALKSGKSEAKGILQKNLLSPVLIAHAQNFRITENLPAEISSASERVNIKAVHSEYLNNRYLSLRDLAAALAGTGKEFALTINGSRIEIDTAGTYTPVGGENEPFALAGDEGYSTGDLKANEMKVDGRTVRYYTFIGKNTEGKPDCYINLMDFCLIMDLNADVDQGVLKLDTGTPLRINMSSLRESGFYDEMRSALCGDATTGEIFEENSGALPVPIASTTKLMTYAVVMDAVTAGEIRMDDTVVISAKAAALSRGQDRVIPMTEGQETTMQELMEAMLIASSNESALALAEHTAGSEEAFVERMMNKAAELGLSESTVFHNSNGLPVFDDDISTAKMQNHMSAEDMFRLVSWLLSVYPQITDITSMTTASLPTLQMDIRNTNALLYNVPGVTGLKTGTTNMAGACVVVTCKAKSESGNHDLVSIVFGAEDNTVRFTSAEVLLRYASQCLSTGSHADEPAFQEFPTAAEDIVRRVLSFSIHSSSDSGT